MYAVFMDGLHHSVGEESVLECLLCVCKRKDMEDEAEYLSVKKVFAVCVSIHCL